GRIAVHIAPLQPAPVFRPSAIAESDDTVTSRSGSATGSGRSMRALKREKIAVFAPIPSASETSATPETIGVARKARSASRRSGIIVLRPAELRLLFAATLPDVAIPADHGQHRSKDRDHHPDTHVQQIRLLRRHVTLHSCASFRTGVPATYSDGDCPSSAPAASFCCRSAAAPSNPPIPIDSTALLGMSINAPFSFRPS